MDILWVRGDSNVRDVTEKLDRSLAYTTVMTTLDRLFKKGFLERRKAERAFIYKPRLSRLAWEQQRAGELVAGFLAGPKQSGELLISCLVDKVGHDASLLDELERKIKIKRKELEERKS
jgi:predicted transcriptional regulator